MSFLRKREAIGVEVDSRPRFREGRPFAGMTALAKVLKEPSRRDTDLIIRRYLKDTASNCSTFVLIP